MGGMCRNLLNHPKLLHLLRQLAQKTPEFKEIDVNNKGVFRLQYILGYQNQFH